MNFDNVSKNIYIGHQLSCQKENIQTSSLKKSSKNIINCKTFTRINILA